MFTTHTESAAESTLRDLAQLSAHIGDVDTWELCCRALEGCPNATDGALAIAADLTAASVHPLLPPRPFISRPLHIILK